MSVTRRSALATFPMALATQAIGSTAEAGDSTANVERRLRYFAEITETTAPKLLIVRGEVELTDEVLEYCREEGVSLDWLFLGDQKAVLLDYRKRTQNTEDFVAALSNIDDRQFAEFLALLDGHVNHGLNIEVAVAGLKALTM